MPPQSNVGVLITIDARDRGGVLTLQRIKDAAEQAAGGMAGAQKAAEQLEKATTTSGRNAAAAAREQGRAAEEAAKAGQAGAQAAQQAANAQQAATQQSATAGREAARAATEAGQASARASRQAADAVRAERIARGEARKEFAGDIKALTDRSRLADTSSRQAVAGVLAEIRAQQELGRSIGATAAQMARLRELEQRFLQRAARPVNAAVGAGIGPAAVRDLRTMNALQLEAERSGNRVIRTLGDMIRARREEAGAARDQAGAYREVSTTGQVAGAVVGRLAVAAGAVVAAIAGFRGLERLLSTGTEFNRTLETAQLGISGVVNAQAVIADSQGRILQGAEKFAVAWQQASDQVRKLRIDALDTLATTQDLVDVLQGAIGPGLEAGLTLNQIRQTVLRMTQAAGALNIPYSQLNVSISMLLSGHIAIRNRLLQALGIRAADVRLAKEQGRLAEFLNDKLAAYDALGQKVNETFKGIRERGLEVLQIFSAETTRPLFDAFKAAANRALNDVFDFGSADLSPAIRSLAAGLGSSFAAAGDLLGTMFARAVEGAKDLGGWMERHRDRVRETASAAGDVVRAVGAILAEAVRVAGAIARWTVESGAARDAMRGVASVIDGIRQNLVLIGTVLIGGVLVRGISALGAAALGGGLATFLSGLRSIPAAAALAATALRGVAAAALAAWPVVLVATIIGAKVAIDAYRAAQERAHRASVEAVRQRAQEQRATATLAGQYESTARVLAQGKLRGAELATAQETLKSLQADLIRQNPEFRSAIQKAGDDYGRMADAVRRVLQEELNLQAVQMRRAAQDRDTKRRELAETEARLRPREDMSPQERAARGANPVVDAVAEQRAKSLREELRRAEEIYDALFEANRELREAMQEAAATPVGTRVTGDPAGEDPAEAAKKLLNDLRQQAEAVATAARAQLEEQKANLDASLEENRIGFRDYFAELERATLEAIDAQLKAQRLVLSATTDTGERQKVLAQIEQLESEKRRAVVENGRKLASALRSLADETRDAQIRLLRLDGREVEARKQELEAQFRDLIARLEANADEAGVRIIRKLINREVAKAATEEAAAEVAKIEGATERRLRGIERRRDQGAISNAQARQETLRELRRERQELEPTIERWIAYHIAVGDANDPQVVAHLDELREKLAAVDTEIGKATFSWRALRSTIRDEFQSGLAEVLGGLGREVTTWGQALVSMADSVIGTVQGKMADALAEGITDGLSRVTGQLFDGLAGVVARAFGRAQGPAGAGADAAGDALQQTAAQAAAQAAAASMGTAITAAGSSASVTMGSALTAAGTSAAAAMGSAITSAGVSAAAAMAAAITSAGASAAGAKAAAAAAGFAVGGHVRGPGTATSDDIPAWLSNGEYVIRAERVRQFGREFFDLINFGGHLPAIRPAGGIPRYAQGGPVIAGGASRTSVDVSGRVQVGLEDGLVPREIRSRGGRDALLEVIQSNRGAIRAILGG